MTRTILATAAFLLSAGLTSPALLAQAFVFDRNATPPPQMIDLATAQKAVDAAEASAIEITGDPNGRVAIAVLDANGDVVVVRRMDTAIPRAVTSAMGHARAALLFGVSAIDLYDAMNAGESITAFPKKLPMGNWEITIEPGGIPIVKDGVIIGAIGVGGIPSLDDEKVAQDAVDALGF